MVEAPVPVDQQRSASGARRHLVGVGLGLLVVAALVGHARLAFTLRTIRSREFVTWPLTAEVGLLFVWGLVIVLIVRFAPRFPAVPTTVAIVLLYGVFASVPILPRLLPLLGPWQPRVAVTIGNQSGYAWPGFAQIMMAGAMTAAAVWGWWRHAHQGPTDPHRLPPGT